MTTEQFTAFSMFRDAFRNKVEEWSSAFSAVILPLQQELAGRAYTVETPIVYNTALDKVKADSDIKLIIVGDNPGKKEQKAYNQAYMVGMSGAVAAGFFRRNPMLGVDFRQNTIILNKTPVHTAKTMDLCRLMTDDKAAHIVHESQVWMAEHTAKLHQCIDTADSNNGKGHNSVKLWVVGYSELRLHGVFDAWWQAFNAAYTGINAWRDVMVYQHFSMNRFAIDLKAWQNAHSDIATDEALRTLGEARKSALSCYHPFKTT